MNDSQNEIKSTIRPAAVAGQFYPANPAELEKMVIALLNGVDNISPPAKAIIAPHAGLVYSGPIAAGLMVLFIFMTGLRNINGIFMKNHRIIVGECNTATI